MRLRMLPKKQLPDLIAQYKLEPTMRDIIVEGTKDKSLIEWYVKESDLNSIHIYVIDDICVPIDLVEKYSLNTQSNRSRVLALSEELDRELDDSSTVMCIVDKDAEDYIPSGIKNRCVCFTDYTSSDMYFYDLSTIRKFLTLVIGGFCISPERLYENLTNILEDLYVARITNVALQWNMKWIRKFTGYVDPSGYLTFDEKRFTEAYLKKNNRWQQRQDYFNKREELRSRLHSDPRQKVRGHDLTKLLNYLLKRRKYKSRFRNTDMLYGALSGCIDMRNLSKTELFHNIQLFGS